MTKQQKEVAQLKREIRKLERDKRMLKEQLYGAERLVRIWQRDYKLLLENVQSNVRPKTRSIVNPKNPNPINRI